MSLLLGKISRHLSSCVPLPFMSTTLGSVVGFPSFRGGLCDQQPPPRGGEIRVNLEPSSAGSLLGVPSANPTLQGNVTQTHVTGATLMRCECWLTPFKGLHAGYFVWQQCKRMPTGWPPPSRVWLSRKRKGGLGNVTLNLGSCLCRVAPKVIWNQVVENHLAATSNLSLTVEIKVFHLILTS